jgi:hypothetical protein
MGAEFSEVEITSQMVEAGFRALCSSGPSDDYLDYDKSVVTEIFLAMLREMHRSQPSIAVSTWLQDASKPIPAHKVTLADIRKG